MRRIENTEVARHEYAMRFVQRIRATVPEATVRYDQSHDDIVLKVKAARELQFPLNAFSDLYDAGTGQFRREGDPLPGGKSEEDEFLDADVVKEFIDEKLCPDLAGVPSGARIRHDRDLSQGAVLCPEFITTKYELELLGEQLLYSCYMDDYSYFHHETSGGSWWKRRIFCNRRLYRIEQVLGPDAMDKVVADTHDRLVREYGDAMWLFLHGNETERHECQDLVQCRMYGALDENEASARLAALRKTAEARRANSPADPAPVSESVDGEHQSENRH